MTYDEALKKNEVDMLLRHFAPDTIRTYTRVTKDFLVVSGRPVDDLSTDDLRKYQVHLLFERGVAPATFNLYSSAVRFFLCTTLNRYINYLQAPNAKEDEEIPVILTASEVEQLLSVCTNLEHRAMFLLAYGSGLRVGEVAALRVQDIASAEHRLWVRHGKGGKDRYTLLPDETLGTLRHYWKQYRPDDPEGWLFLGQRRALGHISERAIESAFKRSLERSGITKDVSFHSLRHSFACRMLESGVDLISLQKLMGHKSAATTAKYLRAANLMSNIPSPADSLFKSHE